MALLTAANAGLAGVDLAGVTPGGSGDTFANTGKEIVLIYNNSGGSINVTLDHQNLATGVVVTDPVVAVGNGVTKAIGPFPPGYYNDGSGLTKVTCSATTNVTIKVLKVTPA